MTANVPQLSAIQEIASAVQSHGPSATDITGVWGSGKTLVAAQAALRLGRSLLIVAPSRIEAEGIHDDLATFLGEDCSALFPAWEVLPTDAMDPAEDIVAERLHALQMLAEAQNKGEPVFVATPLRAVLQLVAGPDQLAKHAMRLARGDELDLEDLTVQLSELGYEREMMVEQRGQISVRGGILDIFPISSELPYRIEFFGDEIESIRRFEPETQRSIDYTDSVDVLPKSEKALIQQEREAASLLDYFAPETLLALDEPAQCAEEAARLTDQFPDNPYLFTWGDFEARAANFKRLDLAHVGAAGANGAIRLSPPMNAVPGWQRDLEAFWQQLVNWDAAGFTVTVYCNNAGEQRRFLELLHERGYRPGKDRFDLRVAQGRLRAGFVSQRDALVVLSEREIFGRHYVKRKRRRFEAGEGVTSYGDLTAGDYVVHEHHGIGRYQGIKRFEGKSGDFLGIQYAGGDTIYIPVTHIDSVQKFIGGDGTAPKIDKLGGASWARTKARARKKIRDMTDELVKLYAAREQAEGHAFNPDSPWQLEFEDEFPYDETPDQARAIEDVKRDMESSRPMDRLICGDVGFGKTEVALRAAFKAVMDSKQVAMLAPTTILAEQHYNTFCERLADYPVQVEMLSRFRSTKQQKETVERLKSGEVDIVIGTHRLISKDLNFKNLGLVIIDEEQRFGVAQKERLKQLRASVDVLTLSATPIPRTLNMAFLGVRDMSVINTAPNDRLPVHTCIEAFDERLIQEAIHRELSREGQVFLLHNRVHNIKPYADLIRKLVPGARVAIGHGQMGEHALEEVMTAFIHREIDVLVCTTIIGSGLDIPNANTIIINNADQFGLAELYQLRGRVGRYKHRAFAYLLVPGDRALTEISRQRLKALEDFSALGSGFRIAMRDLEIRGAGNLLGGEQHGVIGAVGYETYTHLIQEAVAELKGKEVRPRTLPQFDIAIDARIPPEYIRSESQRITLYKRISGAHSVEDIEEMSEELLDRFGPPPGPVQRLLDVMRIRAKALDAGAARLVAGKRSVAIEFDSARFLEPRVQNMLRQQFGEQVSFTAEKRPAVALTTGEESPEALLHAATGLLEALEGT